MSSEITEAMLALRDYMFQNVYLPVGENKETQAAIALIGELYNYYLNNKEEVPNLYLDHADTMDRAVADYVSGMTDNYALIMAEQIEPGLSDGVFQGRI